MDYSKALEILIENANSMLEADVDGNPEWVKELEEAVSVADDMFSLIEDC